jgi:hypothetical protein
MDSSSIRSPGHSAPSNYESRRDLPTIERVAIDIALTVTNDSTASNAGGELRRITIPHPVHISAG